jgi:hypothetical protein
MRHEGDNDAAIEISKRSDWRQTGDRCLKCFRSATSFAIVMTAASGLQAEKRSVFLEHLAARLQLRGSRFTAAPI